MSVVGTLLALLVFFALFGIFLTQYVPLWMTDNESQFTAQAQVSFADLKSNMDTQVALGSPPVFATPFVMASQGIPLIAQPTTAIMNFIPSQPGVYANVSVSVGPGGGPAFYQNFSLGTLQVQLPNRYYSPEVFEYEDDAVIESQSDTHQILAYPPPITINVTGNQTGVTLVLLQMYGNASQTVSSGSQEVYSHFINTQSFTTVRAAPFAAVFQIGTHFPCAWSTFLSTTLRNSGLGAAHYTLTPSTCTASNGFAHPVRLNFNSVNSFTLVVAQFSVVVGVGVE
ncbi:MAG: hypothetical protein L3K19_00095 [Thermoplasmata archaeon]|nr:hypothetical protein [Thermoplasmata archaeon]